MYTKTVATALSLPAVVVSLLFAANAAATSQDVKVTLNVSTRGLDLGQPADARKFYRRLEHAAWILCTNGNRVGLEPIPNPQPCQEKSIGEAIRAIKVPLLTQIYLQTHTLSEAAAHGIEAPVQVASK